ncbi:MAG TPA: hypothetical protein VGE64_09280 [Xanthomonadaceae bacterium]
MKERASGAKSSAPQYRRPKILMVDTATHVVDSLKEEGYNVSSGTFGTPYKVSKTSSYLPVISKASLPNYTEQEIIVIDLVVGDFDSAPPGEKMQPDEEPDWWAKCNLGVIDPRPRAMAAVKDQFDKILGIGGVFVIFADTKSEQELVIARSRRGGLYGEQRLNRDNWGFLSVLSDLQVDSDYGEEIEVIKSDSELVRLLASHIGDASFNCSFRGVSHINGKWISLAKNKYGAEVAGVIAPFEERKRGLIFIFPEIKNKVRFLSGLFKDVLPEVSPGLFPQAEGKKWVHRPEYELPSVLEKVARISVIRDEAAKRISDLEKSIEDDREANLFLYALIRETGDPLVEAIKKALTILGFKSIVDVDEEMRQSGKDSSLREDLRIHDASPVLVVDVKGVAGKPADSEALQAQKHAFIYIQEQKRHDVSGLTIINHQRLIPPLERDNVMPFRNEILLNAEQLNLGLMTGWDLFRLVRNFIKNGWSSEQVIPIFYRTGRILPIPQNFEYIGKVKQVWKMAFSVEMEEGDLRAGEKIAIEFSVDFEEQEVSSLKLNDNNVDVVHAKCEVGIQREESLPRVKAGMSIYRIRA